MKLFATSLTALVISLIMPLQSTAQENQNTSSGTVWTETDWVIFYEYLEDLYVAGADEEEIYWLIRNQLDVLGYAEPILQLESSEIPPPPGSGPGPGPDPEFDPYGGDGAVGIFNEPVPCPPQTSPPTYPFATCPRSPISDVEPPPAWVGVSMMLLGTNLVGAGYTATGYLIVNIGGVIQIWVITDDDEGGGEEEGE